MSYELPVSQNTLYFICAKPIYKFVYYTYPFFGARVSFLVQHLENKRDSHVFVANAKHKNIDVFVAEHPVCPICH